MSQAFQRGSVLLCGMHYGVVWASGAHLTLLPVRQSQRAGRGAHRRAHDVDLTFAELLGASIALPAAFIQAGEPIEVDFVHQVQVGALTGPTLCRVVAAVIRASADAILDARWAAERRHRHEAASIGCVHLR